MNEDGIHGRDPRALGNPLPREDAATNKRVGSLRFFFNFYWGMEVATYIWVCEFVVGLPRHYYFVRTGWIGLGIGHLVVHLSIYLSLLPICFLSCMSSERFEAFASYIIMIAALLFFICAIVYVVWTTIILVRVSFLTQFHRRSVLYWNGRDPRLIISAFDKLVTIWSPVATPTASVHAIYQFPCTKKPLTYGRRQQRRPSRKHPSRPPSPSSQGSQLLFAGGLPPLVPFAGGHGSVAPPSSVDSPCRALPWLLGHPQSS